MGVLRLILAIAVVIAHTEAIFGFRLVGSVAAVQAFYIISGFYMAMILTEKYTEKRLYKLFITNRFLRLYPIYWTVLLGTILVNIVKTSGNGKFDMYFQYYDFMNFGSFLFLIFTNIFMFFQDIVMFLGLDTTTGNLFLTTNFQETSPMLHQFLFIPQAWTIGVELMFYSIVPLLAKKKTKYIIALIFLSLSIRLALAFGFNLKHDPWLYRFFPTELVFFLAGIIGYRLYKYLQQFQIKEIYLKIIWLGILLFTVSSSFLPSMTICGFSVKKWFYLFAFFMSLPFVFPLTKKWKFDRYIGELSYPVYISHMLMLEVCSKFKISTLLGGLGVATTIASILCAIVLNELVQKRIEKIRQKRVEKSTAAANN